MSSELKTFRKYYKWYVFALITMLFLTFAIWYLYEGVLTFEFVIGACFVTFLSTVVYMGAMILRLKEDVEEMREVKSKK